MASEDKRSELVNPASWLRQLGNNVISAARASFPEGNAPKEYVERTYVDQKVDVLYDIYLNSSIHSSEAAMKLRADIRNVVTSIVDDLY